jgi:hypothetical protein
MRVLEAAMNSAKSEYDIYDLLPGVGAAMRIACKL